jgi:peroxiredoxin
VTLLSDWAGEATRGFGVETTVWDMAVSRRSAFLVDGGGTVRAAWAYERGELPDLDAIVAAARSS